MVVIIIYLAWGFGKMQLQTRVEGFLMVPELWTNDFMYSFMTGYINLITAKPPYDCEVPELDSVFDHMDEFFYEMVSFHEYQRDTTAYHYLTSLEMKEEFYEKANEDYSTRFFVDMRRLADAKHICIFVPGDDYINMPVKEVW
jgi:hypothetical protein